MRIFRGFQFWKLEENLGALILNKVEEARREARLKDFKEQRTRRWSILGLKSRSRGIDLNFDLVLYLNVLDALYINL